MPASPERTEKAHSRLRRLALFTALALLMASFYHLWRYSQNETVPARKPCNLNEKTCSVRLPQGQKISFQITPKSAPTVQPITFTTKLTKTHADNISLTLMPLKQFSDAERLTMKNIGHSRYTVTTTLKDTDNTNQNWMAIVSINVDQQNIAIPFKFTANK